MINRVRCGAKEGRGDKCITMLADIGYLQVMNSEILVDDSM